MTDDACPLCGATLGPDQDWCLQCGVAARTRMAPLPHWRRPVILLAVIAVLSVAGITVALVKLTGSRRSTPTITIVRTTPPAAPPAATTGPTGPATVTPAPVTGPSGPTAPAVSTASGPSGPSTSAGRTGAAVGPTH